MEEHPTRRLVDVLAGGDEPDASLLKRPVNLHIIRPVAGEAVKFVDDDVVDPAVFFEVGQHLLQLGPISRASRLTTVGKLLDDQCTHRLGFALVGLTLSREGEPLLRPATLSLLPSRDADVRDGPLGGELGGHSGEGIGGECVRHGAPPCWVRCVHWSARAVGGLPPSSHRAAASTRLPRRSTRLVGCRRRDARC